MTGKRKNRVKSLLLFYLAALVVWGTIGTVGLAQEVIRRENGTVEQSVLDVRDAVWENITELDGWGGQGVWLYSTNSDPQLIWELEGVPVGLVRFDAQSYSRPGGEMVLYYTTRAGQPFSETQKLWARQDEEGRYIFDLGGRKIYGFRLDMDTAGGVIWQVNEISFNRDKPAWQFYVPDVQNGALLLLVPLLCWAAACELWAFLHPALVRYRFERRWREPKQKDESPKKEKKG